MILFYLGMVVFLVLLNGFFVLAEFAAVKIRPTQLDVLSMNGDPRAKTVRHIQNHLDEYLSVCQVGITLASVGLGFVGEPAFARLVSPVLHAVAGSNISDGVIHSTSITAGFILISFLHIVFGELLPKTISIRATEQSALIIAYPMIFFRYLFIVPIWILNTSVNLVLRAIGFKARSTDEKHSENEIRVILEHSQSSGVMSFRGLLLMENILDLETLKVKHAMQSKSHIKTLRTDADRNDVASMIQACRYSRYILLDSSSGIPVGFVNIKDLYLHELSGKMYSGLEQFSRQFIRAYETDPLEQLLEKMQRKGIHIAAVFNKKDEWTGMVTLEDALEEVVGTIEEEYPIDAPVYLSDYLTPDRVLLDVEGDSVIDAVRNSLMRISLGEIHCTYNEIMPHIIERERLGETYVGQGLCIPHARIDGIEKPIIIFSRLKRPLPAPTTLGSDQILYLFILITPSRIPRIHQILLSRIAGIFSSGFLENRLDDDIPASELHNAIAAAEQTSIS